MQEIGGPSPVTLSSDQDASRSPSETDGRSKRDGDHSPRPFDLADLLPLLEGEISLAAPDLVKVSGGDTRKTCPPTRGV